MDLRSRTYAPYNKPNSTKMYVHASSNHPPAIKKEITRSIGKRLSNRSSSEQVFMSAIPEYEKALRDSGFKKPDLTYNPTTDKTRKKNRSRNIVWYNPPFCETVATNIGRKFINIVKKNFDDKNPLTKIFNKNNMRLSYSCMNNIKTLIGSHNSKILNQDYKTEPDCNCL